jgi:cysteinyl-tRNA synthetase
MATELLGEQLDIHCGGVDNIFPHHEAEIAQTEGCTGKKFVRYWLHCAHLLVEGQKMAKSLGNFYTLRDVLVRGYSGREVRYALLRVHYRAQLNFTWEGMDEARQALGRIDEWVARLKKQAAEENVERPTPNAEGRIEEDEFAAALDDDLNVSAALGVLFETIRETNRALDAGTISAGDAAHWLKWWESVDRVLAVSGGGQNGLPPEVAAVAEERVQARLAKDWRRSDELRDQIASLGWEVRDTKEGQTVTRRGGV